MNGSDIKNVLEKLTPDVEMEQRLTEKLMRKNYKRFNVRHMYAIAASLIIILSVGSFGYSLIEKKLTNNSNSNSVASANGIDIPKIQLPERTTGMEDMIGLIVYQGRIYTQCGTKISPDMAEKLKGVKLGTTKGNIDEWSKQKDYAVEFASSIGKADVYAVNGYDKNFRIMTYNKIDGAVYSEFYECFNGIVIKKGDDLFGKLKIENNIKSAKQEKFDSWNHNKQQYEELKNLEELNDFVIELKNTIPLAQNSLSHLFDAEGDGNQRFVYITLNDGCEVQLRLFKDGYIFYNHVFFKMDNKAFSKLWDILE